MDSSTWPGRGSSRQVLSSENHSPSPSEGEIFSKSNLNFLALDDRGDQGRFLRFAKRQCQCRALSCWHLLQVAKVISAIAIAYICLRHITLQPTAREILSDSLSSGGLLSLTLHRNTALDGSFYSPQENRTYSATKGPWYSLRDRLVVVNIESRPISKIMHWTDVYGLPHWAAAPFYNFAYASLHGYQYKHISAPPVANRHPVWTKIPHVIDLLNDHEFVLLLDSDAFVSILDVPIEWLMNRWGFTEKHLMLLPEDPAGHLNFDQYGKVNLNTGAVLLRRSSRTFQILRDLFECPDQLIECAKWRLEWPFEQGAFNNHLKAELLHNDEIKVAPCNEANGYKKQGSCSGIFVTHAWTAKDQVSKWMLEPVLERMSKVLKICVQNSDSKRINIRGGEGDSTYLQTAGSCLSFLRHLMIEPDNVFITKRSSELDWLLEQRRRAGALHPMLHT